MATRTNPDPARITPEMWRFWLEFLLLELSALLGGVFADKPGYHNYRLRLPSRDYSAGGQVAADREGDPKKAAGIDLTMSTRAMRLFTRRLWEAAKAGDPRFFLGGHPILREFIGTLDGVTVVCWVFVGGEPLGVRGGHGPDPGRDRTHLWHIHFSFIRRFVGVWAAYAQILSILSGESLEAWRKRTQKPAAAPAKTSSKGDDDMSWTEPVIANAPWRDVKGTPKVTPAFVAWATWVESHTGAAHGAALVAGQAEIKALLAGLLAAQQGGKDAVAAVHQAVEQMRAEVTSAVVAQFGAAMPALVAHLLEQLGDELDEVTQQRVEAAAAATQQEFVARLAQAFGVDVGEMPAAPAAQLEAPASGS